MDRLLLKFTIGSFLVEYLAEGLWKELSLKKGNLIEEIALKDKDNWKFLENNRRSWNTIP